MASINGGKLVNEKNGKIISNVNSSIAMYSENGTIENKGIIEMKGNDNDGIIGDNSNIINNGTIIGTGNNIVGMETSGKGFTATNNKEITLSGKDSYGMSAIEGATAKNEKGATISIKGENSFGMVAEDSGSEIINNGSIQITGNNSGGMIAEANTIAINNNDITIGGNNSFGMIAEDPDSKILNKGTITVGGDNSTAIYGYTENSVAKTESELEKLAPINEGKIEITGTNSIGINVHTEKRDNKDVWGFVGINNERATITVGGSENTGMFGHNSDIMNKGNINVTGKNSVGMKTTGLSFADNKNFITITGENSTGMLAENGGRVSNEEGGTIKVTGKNSFAMKANGVGSSARNEEGGKIEVNAGNSGIIVTNGANALNDENATISIRGDNSIGMLAKDSGSNANNNGNIEITGNNSVGMLAENGGKVTNEIGGTIKVNDKDSFAMKADGTGSLATNKEGAIINGGGMFATNGAEANNEGTIEIDRNLEISPDSEPVTEYLKDFSFAMKGLGNNSLIKNNGEITTTGDNSDGMLAKLNTTATNNGTININGNNSSGMNASQGATITNNSSGIININGTGSNGMFVANNSIATNDGTIKVTQDFIPETDNLNPRIQMSKGMYILNEGTGTNNKSIEVQGSSIGMFTDGKNANAINNGTITLSGKNSQSDKFVSTIGMASIGGGKLVNETNGKIVAKVNSSTAMLVENSSATNNGLIELMGNNNEGISGASNSNITNNGSITIGGNDSSGIRVVEGATATNEKNATISITGDESIGMKAKDSDSKILNKGTIIVGGNDSSAMYGYAKNSIVKPEDELRKLAPTNEGTINITGTNSRGIDVIAENRTDKDTWGFVGVNNEGATINVGGSGNTGMFGNNSDVVNYGNINVTGKNSFGMMTTGLSFADNKGVITVTGENSVGMLAENGGRVTNGEEDRNVGVINVNGKGSYAMKADGFGSKALNEIGGTINVGANASGGILATNGATISNEGTINIDSSHGLTADTKVGFALQTQGEGSTIINTGTINADGTVTVTSGTNYVLGTTKSGSYGKISAKSINLDGNVIVDSTIASVDFKDSYTLDNAISSEETKLGKDFKVLSNTMLYNATAKKDDSKNNLDVELSRNENNLVDFTSKEYDNLASVFDKGINDKEFRDTLSDKAKEVLNNVFANTTSGQNIQNRLKEISGVEYTNIARQIFDTKDIFKSYDSSIINTLNDYQFNFNFIGNYSDVEAKGNLLGYESQMTGISGAMKFNDSLYGVIGYGYNDIDFDGKSEGNIKSVHTGIYKDMKLNSFDVRLGVFGEYNFHEVERDLTNEIAKGDFNSYLLGTTGEISQRFGDSLYIKPTLSLDVTYGKYEDFTEDGAKGYNLTVDSQDYTSIVPAVEVKVGKDFKMASIYSAVKFGYEFGDMNKLQYAKLGEFDKKTLPFTDEIENAQTDVKVGTAFEFNNFTFNAEVGKDFGKRDREYITAGFTYTF